MTPAHKLTYYQQLITHYREMIFRVSRIYAAGDAEFMDDLFQEISIALWESLENYQGRSQESTWVWNVAQKKARYCLRKRKVEEKHFQRGLPEEAYDTPTEGDRSEDIEELYGAIAQLDPDDQLLVTLRLDEKSYREISALTGIAEGVLRTRYSRIVQQLRQIMTGTQLTQ